MGVEEIELCRQAVEGDREALVTLLEQHGPDVRRSLEGGIPPHWRSLLAEDDVLQQTYVDAFRDIRRFEPRGEGAFAAWLRQLARRNLLDALRMLEAEKRGGRRKRVEPIATEESYLELYELIGAATRTPSQKVAAQEARDALEKALERLPADYLQVVRLFDLEGLTALAVAESVERSVGAVYMLRARAHRLLGEMIGPPGKYLSSAS